MTNINYKKEEKETKGISGRTKGLIILGAVGLGAYVYGCVGGVRAGYRWGFNNGIIHTVNNFEKGMQVIIEEAGKSKGGS